ncbi:MAG: hypothetical protein LBP28_00635 [Coriobacteriales bacterium]|jgi:hypothetical protein|nr:hypothetical protein [Coriobacteriales bacterium]
MAGYGFTVNGDAAVARDTVYQVLQGQGFTVTPKDEWSALAERGGQGASVILGAFAGKKGRHVKLDISCASDGQGNTSIQLVQGTSGISGGLIGKSQADSIYNEAYGLISQAFQGSGILLAHGKIA